MINNVISGGGSIIVTAYANTSGVRIANNVIDCAGGSAAVALQTMSATVTVDADLEGNSRRNCTNYYTQTGTGTFSGTRL